MATAHRIVTYERLSDLWEAELAPWFARSAGFPTDGAKLRVVVAPDGVRLGALKRHWLASGGGALLGTQFWSPERLRHFLVGHHFPGARIATQEDLSLAVKLAVGADEEETAETVVARNPGPFLAAWEARISAQADREVIAGPWRSLPEALEKRLSVSGFSSERQADWRLARLPRPERPLFDQILIDGFTAAHCVLYPLLIAAISHARESLCSVPLPRARRVEELWLGTLEEVCGSIAEPAVSVNFSESVFTRWARLAEEGGSAAESPPAVDFRLFSQRGFEVEALADRVETLWRRGGEDITIGVVLPAEPLLVRTLASELIARRIPLYDTFGFMAAPGGSERLLSAWIEYQRKHHAPAGQAFLEELVEASFVTADAALRIEESWTAARESTGSDDLAVLTAYRPGWSRADEQAYWQAQWPRLPSSGTVAHFVEVTMLSVQRWEGGSLFAKVHESPWMKSPEVIDRESFLEWLSGLTRPGRARHESGRNAFAPVQLVRYESIRSSRWDHLILAGLNEGLVPVADQESAFLVADGAERHLRKSIMTGSHGEGHLVLRPGRGFFFDGADRRASLSGAILDAVAEAVQRVELFATYAPQGQDRTATVLSELYLRLHRAARGADAALPPVESFPVGEEAGPTGSTALPPLEATRRAHLTRNDPSVPFDEHSFGFAHPPLEAMELGARDWEAVLQRPATVWLSAIAHVRPRMDLAEPVQANLQFGSAVHRLLGLPSDETWHHLGKVDWTGGITRRAQAWRHAVESAYLIADRAVSPVWKQSWGLALSVARRLAAACSREDELCWLASEMWLPAGARVETGSGEELQLRGRIDALLVNDPERPQTALVVDFKTGADKEIMATRAKEGKALQLVLYAGALARDWSIPIGICLLKPGGMPTAQLVVEPGNDPSGLIASLARIGRSGVFGFGGEVRNEFRFVGEYPLAFVPPRPDVVESKWVRTHPDLPVPKGSGE